MADESELRAVSDKMLSNLERLAELENLKRTMQVGSEEFVQTAREVEDLSRLVFRWSGVQMQLAIESRIAAGRQDGTAVRLTDVQPRPLDRVLALWREAQIRLEISPPGSADAAAATDEIERLREEYQATTERKLAEDGADRV